MKELTTQEKAKRFDEALEKARRYYDEYVSRDNILYVEDMEDMFPELKESEDERMSKYLIKYFEANKDELSEGFKWNGITVEECIDWLEKQGKPIDKIVKRAMTEKQRVLLTETNGDANIDWDTRSLKDAITLLEHGLNYLQEIEVKKQTMPSSRFGGCSEYIPTRFDKEKQGKQGEQNLPSFDESQGTPILKQGEQKPVDRVEPQFKVGDWVVSPNGVYWHIDDIRDGRYQVCSDTGDIADWPLDAYIYHRFSVRDAKDGDILADGNLPFVFKKIDANKYSYAYCGISVDDGFKIESDGESGEWTRMQDIKPATKEQCDLLFKKMREAGYEWDAEKKELKKIEQKTAWSEEDERMFNSALWHVKNSCGNGGKNSGEFEVYNWLKSLKERVGNFDDGYKVGFSAAKNNQWKPSEEQINALKKAKDGIIGDVLNWHSKDRELIDSLYNDLKILMRE